MSEFNFNSAVCTSIEQSRKLLSLGLKKETADMYLQSVLNDVWSPFVPIAFPYSDRPEEIIVADVVNAIPAWSLSRLIEMMPRYIHQGNMSYERTLFPESVCYYKELYKDCGDNLIAFDSPNLYDRIIHCIEWLIKEGYFNKEYLV